MQSSWGPRVFWLSAFLLVVAGVFAWFYDPMSNSDFERARDNLFRQDPVIISPQLIGCNLQIGLGDQEPTLWKGEIRLIKGRLLQVIPTRTGKNVSLQRGQFELSSFREEQTVLPAILTCAFLADASDSLVVLLGNEKKVIGIPELQSEQPLVLFDGKVKLSRSPPIQALRVSEDDAVLPFLSNGKKENEHMVWLNCERNKTIDAAAVLSGNLDSLQRKSSGVSVRLSHFQKGTWSGAEDITGALDAALDPIVAADQSGRIYVAWSQPGSDGWDIYYRVKDSDAQANTDNAWTEPRKVTEHPGSVQGLIATTDAKGKIWLVWQTWHYGHYDIYAAVINDETHAWHTPGPVADHGNDSEGRWYPAVASDSSGSVFVAWSVFRQGGFDVELVKLGANAAKTQPQVIAASLRQGSRTSLACDSRSQLWIAYEDSNEAQGTHNALSQSDAKIHVRLLDSQQRLFDLPPAPLPKTRNGGPAKQSSCSQPHLITLDGNIPLLAYVYRQKLYFTVLNEQGWSEPQELARASQNFLSRFVVAFQADCVVAYTEGQDETGRSRLHVTAENFPSAGRTALSKLPVTAQKIRTTKANDWNRFQENIRLFRGRPQDPELANKHLLRGLVLLPADSRQQAADSRQRDTDNCLLPATCFEKLMCDWAFLPGSSDEPACSRWISQLQHQAFSQKSERSLLSGYYRECATPLQGVPRGEPALIVQNRLDFAPLPTQKRLYSFLPHQESLLQTPIAREADARLLERYLAENQELGFTLTSDWRALATYNPPTTARTSDQTEDALMPFWYQPELEAIRVIAYANGKSQESLIEALRDRHFYFATDDIYLLARCDKRVPGEVFQTARVPVITVQAQGTGKLAKVEIWRDNKVIMSEEPPGAAAVLECPNPDIDRAWHHYIVRILQENGAIAVTQPFWIRYQP